MAGKRKDSKNKVLKEGEIQRANQTYEFRWRDSSKRRHSIYAKTLEELREKEKSVTRDILDGIVIPDKKMTVSDLYEKWYSLKRGMASSTMSSYDQMFNCWARNEIGDMRVAKVRTSDLTAFFNFLHDERHLKVATILQLNYVLKQVFDMAIADNIIRQNPTTKAVGGLRHLCADESEQRISLTVPEQMLFEDFLKRSKYVRWYPIFTVMLWTGMRAGEAVTLRWCDVDMETNSISIDHTASRFKIEGHLVHEIHRPKTKTGIRTIPMLPVVKEALFAEKARQQEAGLVCTETIGDYTDFIFLKRSGLVFAPNELNPPLYRIVKACNEEQNRMYDGNPPVILPHISCHILRHTYTTRMCEAGMRIKSLQNVLGHKNASTTLDVYAASHYEMLEDDVAKARAYYESMGLLPSTSESANDSFGISQQA